MKQNTEVYWPQYKVFFLATLALFPDNLTARPLDPWFFSPYFNFAYHKNLNKGLNKQDPGLEWVATMLDEYKKGGYVRYKKVNGLYEITKMDTEKATKDLIRYLKKWQQNKLSSLSASKPPDAEYQQELLLDAIVRARTNHNAEPRIIPEDIYGKRDGYSYDPPFWELVLSYQLLDNKVKIRKADYDRRQDYLYENDAQPYVEYKIVDKKLLGLIEQRVAQKAEPEPPTVPASIVTAVPESTPAKREGRVIKDGRLICIAITDDKTYTIKRLEKGGTYDKFMDYVLDEDNANIDVSLKDINGVDGLKSAKNLGLLARYSGFVKPFKRAFFTARGKERIRFRQSALLDNEQIEAIKILAQKV